MIKVRGFFFFTFLSVFFPVSLSPFAIRSSVDKKDIYIGDEFKYTIVVEFPKGIRVERPGPTFDVSPFELKGYKIFPSAELTNRQGWVREKIDYTLTLFRIGSFSVPAAQMRAVSNGSSFVLKSDPIEINVKGVADEMEGGEKPFDIRPNWSAAGYIKIRYILILAGILILICAGIIVFRYRERLFGRPKPPLPPYETASGELSLLAGKRFLQQGKYQSYYYELSALFRKFLEGIYAVPCTTLTTRQILACFAELKQPLEYLPAEKKEKDVSPRELPLVDVSFLDEFFHYADRVKFINMEPDVDRSKGYEKKIREYIGRTREVCLPIDMKLGRYV